MATATYISSSSFSVSGMLLQSFRIGRSVRCNCGTAGLFTGYINKLILLFFYWEDYGCCFFGMPER
jgi:hypothetical protein